MMSHSGKKNQGANLAQQASSTILGVTHTTIPNSTDCFERVKIMQTYNQLTTQERKILALVATGRRNAKIALELCISTRTVENHLYHIFDKLGVSSRLEATLHVMNTGLLSSLEISGIAHDAENASR
jgi:DNA-binding NarL/FixJ family response regulator